jgi:RND superfamily putative drug exporter
MVRLHDFLSRHRRLVLATWLVVLLGAAPFAVRQTDHLTSGGFLVPGSGSEKVDDALADFENAQRETLAVVLAQREGATPVAARAEVDRVSRIAAEVDHAELTPAAARRAKEQAGSETILVIPLHLEGSHDELADVAVEMRDELDVGHVRNGVEPHLVGQQALWAGMQDLSKEDLEAAETTGFPIVLLILLAVFGSLVAASLPLALGFGSVFVSGAGIFFLSQATEMSVFVTNVASMIGIGVAVDYSLFVLARYREEIRAERAREDALRVAMRTSGIAVVFSGVTVLISLAGLFLVDSTVIRSMAMGAIMVVAIAILAAVTLLPALISLFGRRAYSRSRTTMIVELVARQWRNLRRRPGSTRPERRRGSFWQRWTDAVTRRPWLAAGASAAVMLTLAIPALSLEWGDGALRQFPVGNETRVGAELAAKVTGPGASGPMQIVADAGDPAAIDRYVAKLRRDPEVAKVEPPVASRDGESVLIVAQSKHDPESPQARALVDRVRADGIGGVGGATASVEDFKDLVSGSMWKILLFVLAFSYVVLFVLLRSVLLPLKAVLMNLLSVAAAYGVLVAVFQYGWIDGFLGFESLGYINTMTPPFLLAIVFGLSMDYEVFLLSRIRERYEATGDNRRAVAEGLRASARTISSAALIMVAVFAVFASAGVPAVKEIGLGLSVAIALDATLVRLVLVPATMELMGRWNWWLPKRIDRVLPHTDFERAPGPAKA